MAFEHIWFYLEFSISLIYLLFIFIHIFFFYCSVHPTHCTNQGSNLYTCFPKVGFDVPLLPMLGRQDKLKLSLWFWFDNVKILFCVAAVSTSPTFEFCYFFKKINSSQSESQNWFQRFRKLQLRFINENVPKIMQLIVCKVQVVQNKKNEY